MSVKLTIKAEGPLSFSIRKPGGIFQKSLPYIPGTVLRGAMAFAMLGGKDHELPHAGGESCEFCQVFLDETAAIFTNAYPTRDPEDQVRVLPATAFSCKNNSGFLPAHYNGAKSDEHDEHSLPASHGVFDTLIERLCWELLDPPALVYNPTCPLCGSRVEAYGGFYVRHDHDQHRLHYHPRDVDQRLLTRVAINRRRMVAEDNLLYSPYVISQAVEEDKHAPGEKPGHMPVLFVGHVRRLPEKYETQLEKITALGGSSSRGLGHVSIKVEDGDEVETGDENVESWRVVKERVTALDAKIKAVWEEFQSLGGQANAKKGIYFTVDLWSDAVLYTKDGLPTMVFDGKLLEAATKGQVKADLVRSYASYGYSGGWQSAWGLPKPVEVLARTGSVYVFQTEALTDAGYQALTKLEILGIGEHTVEGYGQVHISDEFHLKRRGIQ